VIAPVFIERFKRFLARAPRGLGRPSPSFALLVRYCLPRLRISGDGFEIRGRKDFALSPRHGTIIHSLGDLGFHWTEDHPGIHTGAAVHGVIKSP
jgi:hypothetical protein